jgi:hypothetical protein
MYVEPTDTFSSQTLGIFRNVVVWDQPNFIVFVAVWIDWQNNLVFLCGLNTAEKTGLRSEIDVSFE